MDAVAVVNARNVYFYNFAGSGSVRGVRNLIRTRHATNTYVQNIVADSLTGVIKVEGNDTVQFYGDTLRTITNTCGDSYEDTVGVAYVSFYQTALEDCGTSGGQAAFNWVNYQTPQKAHSLQFYLSTVTTRTNGAAS